MVGKGGPNTEEERGKFKTEVLCSELPVPGWKEKDGGGLGSLHGLEAALIKVKETTTAVRNKSKFTVPEGLGEMKTETCEEDTERL